MDSAWQRWPELSPIDLVPTLGEAPPDFLLVGY